MHDRQTSRNLLQMSDAFSSSQFETFEARLASHFPHEPTEGQSRLFYAFKRFMFSEKEHCALLLKGYAGTGKTSSVVAMVNTLEELGVSCVLLAPTGRAAKVLSTYTGRNAWTIHRHIYQMTSEGGFFLRDNVSQRTVYFIDESSMIGTGQDNQGADLLDDLMTFIFQGDGCRVLFIGDQAQLPPVGSSESPALQLDYLRRHYALHIGEVVLDEVVRQARDSGILAQATRLREQMITSPQTMPKLSRTFYPDVVNVQEDLQGHLESAVSQFGIEDVLIITRSNKRANLYNQEVRVRLLWHEEEINSGERMLVVKNNYFWLDESHRQASFIANGDILRIQRVLRFEDRGEFRFCRAIVALDDYPNLPSLEVILLCNSILDEQPSLSQEKLQALARVIAEDYPDITDERMLRKALRRDPYYNAIQVKFAYAVTCHKSQGGQWPCVFLDQGYLTDDMVGLELLRWYYTGMTRASQKLYLVGFSDNLFEDSCN